MSDTAENSAEKNAAADFPVWQTQLLAKTGLPVKEFRALRSRCCVRGVDWRIGQLNHIEFTVAGAEKILAAALQKSPPASAPDVPRPATAATQQLTHGGQALAQGDVMLEVAKTWPQNRARLQARVLQNGLHRAGELVVVRVRDNQRHKPGTQIAARHIEGNVYAFAGKGPR